MGGPGSGSWYRWSKRDTVEDYRSIDVRRFQREKLLAPGQYFRWKWTDSHTGEIRASIQIATEENAIRLIYKWREGGGEWQDEDYPVRLDWTPCNYGGKRPWFLCPNCRRRVAMLYSSRLFVCRRCLDLAYACQQESEPFRLLRKAQRLHRRLGGDGALDFGFYVPKPKGMHWRTYRRLIAKGERAERAATLSMFHSLGGAVNLEDLIG